MTTWAVYLYFLESGREEWAATCYLAGCGGYVMRGGRPVPLTRARIVGE